MEESGVEKSMRAGELWRLPAGFELPTAPEAVAWKTVDEGREEVSRSIRNSPLRTIEISPPLTDGGGTCGRESKLKLPMSPPCTAAGVVAQQVGATGLTSQFMTIV